VIGPPRHRLAIVYGDSGSDVDAIRDASFLLARALRAEGLVADAYVKRRRRSKTPGPEQAASREAMPRALSVRTLMSYDGVVVQYNPFSYGRWGFAPGLPARLLSLRLANRPKIGLVVHEPYVPMVDWRSILMGLWQRIQLLVLRTSSDVAFASIERWVADVGTSHPRRPTFHLPMGSTIPCRLDARSAERKRLNVGESELVLATFGTAHPSRMLHLVGAAANALADQVGRVWLLNLGANAPVIDDLDDRVRLRQPGRLPAGDLARLLATADIYLAPFIDGVSTRRTTVMAALQHGVPVVGTDGPLTDSLLRDGSLVLIPVERPDLFVAAVISLARDPRRRLELSESSRALYRSTFSWPILAKRLLSAFAGHDSDTQ
jgi:glycosyltransferase involved in cell wall biosynthesis